MTHELDPDGHISDAEIAERLVFNADEIARYNAIIQSLATKIVAGKAGSNDLYRMKGALEKTFMYERDTVEQGKLRAKRALKAEIRRAINQRPELLADLIEQWFALE